MKFAAPAALALAMALFAGSTFAADATPAPAAKTLTPQQQKTSDCAKDAHAKGLKGDDYKSFMSTCMKSDGSSTAPATTNTTSTPAPTGTPAAKPAGKWVAAPAPGEDTAAGNSQQQKMKSCNADATAKGLKGNDRKTFMSTCLKGDSATPAAH